MTDTREPFLDRAQRAVAAGLEWSGARNIRMAFVVLDVTGTVCAAARMDGSRTVIYDIALAKANTAREFQASTDDLAQRVKPENRIALGQILPRIAFLGGGVPIMNEGAVIGGIGASGGTEDQDVECAEVCLAAFSGRH